MPLATRTTLEDVIRFCQYLSTKPTGATAAEAKRILGASLLSRRKVSALKYWELIEDADGRLKVTDNGRVIAKDTANGLPRVMKHIIRSVEPYSSVIERAAHNDEGVLIATDIAAYWHSNFSEEVANNDEMLNEQALCFFHVVYGAELGELTLGRKGSPTRITLNQEAVERFISNGDNESSFEQEEQFFEEPSKFTNKSRSEEENSVPPSTTQKETLTKKIDKGVQRVFITHSKNTKIVEQIKEIVTYGKLIPVVAEEHETLSKPIPEKVMDDMRSCDAGIIHVAAEQVLVDKDGKSHNKINENVLIEIGAAMALYRNNFKYNFILLVEKGVQLPSNLQGLYECRYEGDELSGEATMKLLKAFNEFGSLT